jgi:hypothetical protein
MRIRWLTFLKKEKKGNFIALALFFFHSASHLSTHLHIHGGHTITSGYSHYQLPPPVAPTPFGEQFRRAHRSYELLAGPF